MQIVFLPYDIIIVKKFKNNFEIKKSTVFTSYNSVQAQPSGYTPTRKTLCAIIKNPKTATKIKFKQTI